MVFGPTQPKDKNANWIKAVPGTPINRWRVASTAWAGEFPRTAAAPALAAPRPHQ